MSKYISSMATGILFLHVKNSIHQSKNYVNIQHCFGFGSGLDPDSIRSVDPEAEEGKNEKEQKEFSLFTVAY